MPTLEDVIPQQEQSWRYCEVCNTGLRTWLIRFDDGSVFTLCDDCELDLEDVAKTFAMTVAISRM